MPVRLQTAVRQAAMPITAQQAAMPMLTVVLQATTNNKRLLGSARGDFHGEVYS